MYEMPLTDSLKSDYMCEVRFIQFFQNMGGGKNCPARLVGCGGRDSAGDTPSTRRGGAADSPSAPPLPDFIVPSRQDRAPGLVAKLSCLPSTFILFYFFAFNV